MKKKRRYIYILLLMLTLFVAWKAVSNVTGSITYDFGENNAIGLSDVPAFLGKPYVTINQNVPFFTEDELTLANNEFEIYSELDAFGRCGAAFANVGMALMPTEARGEIGMIKPSGWQTKKYPELIEDKYLYNRCHLIAYELSGENANEKNLITGTRFMNVQGMLPFENEVAAYIKKTGQHVLYRVTPVFSGKDLVAAGVLMEALSVEDQGKGICFCVFCYNEQPGIEIDHSTGASRPASQ